jgi:hypothetical protein
VEQIVLDHDRVRGAVLGGYGEWSMDVEWLLEEAARTAARRDWRRMGFPGEDVAYGLIVATYRRRMGVIAVREMARHRHRHRDRYRWTGRLPNARIGTATRGIYRAVPCGALNPLSRGRPPRAAKPRNEPAYKRRRSLDLTLSSRPKITRRRPPLRPTQS